MTEQPKNNEMVLSQGEFAYLQDTSKGSIVILTGPNVVTLTGQQYPVRYDVAKREFVRCSILESKQQNVMLAQGHYAILWNPAEKEDDFPPAAVTKQAPDLNNGRRVVLHGPRSFALWPRQSAKVIKGHYLRSNQYVLCRVFDEESAKANYDRMVMRTVTGTTPGTSEPQTSDTTKTADVAKVTDVAKITGVKREELSHGKQFIVRGTEVSFFMPPTGIRVVPESDEIRQTDDRNQGAPRLLSEQGRYVREALTLERLQYAILVDENGDKRYEKGPQVVFPRPTERFYADKQGNKIFKATELNEGQGIYIKVIAPYNENGRDFHEGQELFITGKDTTIYFPRPEHALLKYEGHSKHFATAIPEGEARYVMNRQSAEIRTIRGPTMLLPDPRKEVIVRRALSDDESLLWYPGNAESLEHNRTLRQLQQEKPTTRAAVSETEFERAAKGGRRMVAGGTVAAAMNFMADTSDVHSAASGAMADEFVRGSSYTEPRTITLNTKYAGVPRICPHTGFAVMVVNASGKRRVVKGPATILLEYDESLEKLSLSKGKPKTTDHLERTVYLRVENNQVGDIVEVETGDHVRATVKLSLRGDFFGETPELQNRWFSVENYVKLVTDHVRSVLKGVVLKKTIKEFHGDATAIVRDAILGAKGADGKRVGMIFDEINFAVRDVEVLHVAIGDAKIAALLDDQQHHVITSDIALGKARKAFEVDQEKQKLDRDSAAMLAETQAFQTRLAEDKVQRDLHLTQVRLEAARAETEIKRDVQRLSDEAQAEALARQLERDTGTATFKQNLESAALQQEMQRIRAQTEAVVAKFQAAAGPFSEAIQLLGNQDVAAKVAQALSAQQLFGGENAADVLKNVFVGTGLESYFQRVLDNSAGLKNGNGNGSKALPSPTAPASR